MDVLTEDHVSERLQHVTHSCTKYTATFNIAQNSQFTRALTNIHQHYVFLQNAAVSLLKKQTRKLSLKPECPPCEKRIF
jgi:hypothetical protein